MTPIKDPALRAQLVADIRQRANAWAMEALKCRASASRVVGTIRDSQWPMDLEHTAQKHEARKNVLEQLASDLEQAADGSDDELCIVVEDSAPMTAICAWCGRTERPGDPLRPVTHTLCPVCEAQLMAPLDAKEA